ncbi:hypothetical protein DZK25_12355 [Wenzhouxiangella sp. 15181]|nr:hypothetical protein DZK25_12355 [Wenzhouxiangella sp. 15181]RFP70398.1 hypothetical protein DZK26_00090 [Wenzhouxiangella sp. 15190]
MDKDPGHHREDATEIVLLGTTHFAGSTTDRHGTGVADILSERRQQELEDLASRIADWETDRFFVECSPENQSIFDSDYRAYRNGDLDLAKPGSRSGRGEIHQLAFRAASARDLDGVDCADAEVLVPDSRARQVAKEHNPQLLKSHRQFAKDFAATRPSLAEHSLRQFLLEINTESSLRENHKNYIYYYARMGSFEGSGAEIRRESDLAGSTFRADLELEPQHMEDLRGAIESVDARLVDTPDAEVDYVIVRDRDGTESEGRHPETRVLSLREFSSLLERTSTNWIGFTEHHIGADMVAQWYKRNLRIYANVAHEVEEKDDRVVLMMGQAHIWTLRQFFRDNPDFKVVPVAKVL